MTRYDRATGFFKDPNVLGPFLVPAMVYTVHRLAGSSLLKSFRALLFLLVVGLALLLTFSRGAWFNMAAALAIYGGLYVLTVPSHRARLKFMSLCVLVLLVGLALVPAVLQLDAVSNIASERLSLSQRYDEGPEGRFGGQEKAVQLATDNPFGIGAQQFVPHHHHEEPHNVYVTMFLNAGWLGGLLFFALVWSTAVWGLRHAFVRTATQPLFQVVYACFVANSLEGFIIDLDHWRHFYLLLALVWGLMLSRDGSGVRPLAASFACLRGQQTRGV
jgi:hypothetical protein